jgi:hypothetical protein
MSQTDGVTPLHLASRVGHIECVRALLDGGAAINQATVSCANFDGSALRGLFPRGSVGALPHAYAAGGMVALRVAEGLGKRWSSPCFT